MESTCSGNHARHSDRNSLRHLRDHSTTLQGIEAEAEVDGKWISLRREDDNLSFYELAFDQETKFANTGLRNIFAKKKPLNSLMSDTSRTELRRGVGYQGWTSFELVIETDKLFSDDLKLIEIPMRVSLVDAMEGRHPVSIITPLEETGRVAYSQRALDAMQR